MSGIRLSSSSDSVHQVKCSGMKRSHDLQKIVADIMNTSCS